MGLNVQLNQQRFSLAEFEVFSNVINASHQIKTNQKDEKIYTFTNAKGESKELAIKFSDFLEKLGVVGSTGKKKFVRKFIKGTDEFGVILTPDNITIIQKFQKIMGERKYAGELSGELKKALTDSLVNNITLKFNLENLAQAFYTLSLTGDFSAETNVADQKVANVFYKALDADLPEGIKQSIKEMKEQNEEMELVQVVEKAVVFIEKLRTDHSSSD